MRPLDAGRSSPTLGEPRLSEFVARYEALGYEVEVLPLPSEEAGERDGESAIGSPEDARSLARRHNGTLYVRKPMPRHEDGQP